MKKYLFVFLMLLVGGFGVYLYYSIFDGYDENNKEVKILKFGSKLIDLSKFSNHNGKIIQKYSSGEIKSIDEIVNGEFHGTRTMFYKNGAKFAILEFKNGFSDGNITAWYESGEIKIIGNLKNGKQSGLNTIYHKNGVKKQEGFYIDDKLNGEAKMWNENGELIQVGIFDKGELVELKGYKKGENGGVAEIGINKKDNSVDLKINGDEFKF
ncbi:toxin-antitoxin system YwqK family antitoxin [Campylobacter sp. JMF_08 NE1]|uniref:toxin-antitoxin system YwqK family antitoxin n=1 Tax=Campylobacter sp. JMF_08 NE1 TaxID=2983821 RepID=UPI0022E9F055|nr:hypothetical protein [Campylobacter sp. JMF_08 NE1]MDA3047586.1 hypothetical protein [Campylobacter sp. JMF_08 NE1]